MSEKETGHVFMTERGPAVLHYKYERLQAERTALALQVEQMRQMAEARNAELLVERTALALRVKELKEALLLSEAKLQHYNGDYQGGPHIKDVRDAIKAALASTDKTADEVLAEWLGEPVVGVVLRDGVPTLIHPKNLLRTDTKLYAPRTEVTK